MENQPTEAVNESVFIGYRKYLRHPGGEDQKRSCDPEVRAPTRQLDHAEGRFDADGTQRPREPVARFEPGRDQRQLIGSRSDSRAGQPDAAKSVEALRYCTRLLRWHSDLFGVQQEF